MTSEKTMALFTKSDAGKLDDSKDQSPHSLAELTKQLGHVGALVSAANERLAEYLAARESESAAHNEQFAGALGAEFSRLADKLDRLTTSGLVEGGEVTAAPSEVSTLTAPVNDQFEKLESKLDDLLTRTSGGDGSGTQAVAELLETMKAQTSSMSTAIQQLQDQMASGFENLADLLRPEDEPEEDETAPAGVVDWQRAILGELSENPGLSFQREQLMSGVLEGEPAACGLAGQLLVFQSAPPERLPTLLKDLGEAYYRWQPKTTPEANTMEDALVTWLHGRCEAAGIYNTIELVHPGERFDSARHNASSRGVEIMKVLGWIVLRDNGRVYMKASVDVR
jgi:hypothetical protein